MLLANTNIHKHVKEEKDMDMDKDTILLQDDHLILNGFDDLVGQEVYFCLFEKGFSLKRAKGHQKSFYARAFLPEDGVIRDKTLTEIIRGYKDGVIHMIHVKDDHYYLSFLSI